MTIFLSKKPPRFFQTAFPTGMHKRGYSLIELAIVIAVIGTIMGLIWGYSTTAYDRARRQQMLSETVTLVNNIRGAYAGQLGVPTKGFGTLIPLLVTNHTIPSEMVRTPTATSCTNTSNICVDTPWGSADPNDYPAAPGTIDPGGTVRVCDWTPGQTGCNSGCPPAPAVCTGGAQTFAIVIRNISIGACIQLVTALSGSQGPTGLSEVNINGCDILGNVGCGGYVTTPSLPVATTDMNNLCNLGNSANIIRLIYSLRLPSN